MPWHSRSPAETRALGRGLAASSPDEGGVVSLAGPLGAGKTVLAKGVAEGLGLDPERTASPTFVIASEVGTPGGLRLVHADFYRVESADELEAAGLHDWLAPGTFLLVEWGDRFPEVLPGDRLEVRLVPLEDDSARRVEANGGGPLARAWLDRWRKRCP